MNKLEVKIIYPKLIKNNVLKFLKEHQEYNNKKFTITPSLCDVHVHFREPGFSYKETIKTGTMAAIKGGYTSICTMPNLNPVPDSISHLKEQIKIIKKDALVDVYPYGSLTVNEEGKRLSNIDKLSSYVIGFSDDGHGVDNASLMDLAMKKVSVNKKIISAHCEVKALSKNGYIHDGKYAKENNHVGISSESEYKEVERDIKLIKDNKCPFHVCHVSTRESLRLIKKAKSDKVNITCETAPHYILLNDSNLKEDGYYKINPPIRDKKDQLEIIKCIKDGTIDMIATDHAPHSEKEKNKGLKNSSFGAVGLEIAFSLLYTYLVKKKIITLDKLIELMAINPRKRFSIPFDGSFVIWSLDEKYKIDNKKFFSKGKATPFNGYEVYGVNVLTYYKNKIVLEGDKIYAKKK